jgi:CheY-like chemotaxis protein
MSSPGLRLRRLDSLLALLARALAPRGERLEDALDALLDACPALGAAVFQREPPKRLGERRLDAQAECDADALRAALQGLAHRTFQAGSGRLFDLRPDRFTSSDTAPLLTWGARAALTVLLPRRQGETAIVIAFADPAMLDEETLRYVAAIGRISELALKRDAAEASESRIERVLGELGQLGVRYETTAQAASELELLGDPTDPELARGVRALSTAVTELGVGLDRLRAVETLRGNGTSERPSLRASRKVLLIDDDPVFSRSLRRALSPHEVRTAETASEAEIALLDLTYDPDLVVCDVSLPGANGNVLHARIAARRPELAGRFVFVTGGALDEDAASYLARSRCATLYKPFEVEALQAFLQYADPRASAASPAGSGG